MELIGWNITDSRNLVVSLYKHIKLFLVVFSPYESIEVPYINKFSSFITLGPILS